MALGLLDVLRPRDVIAHRIDAETDDLTTAPFELRLESGHVAELVVQTGVKSFGCENSTAQPSAIQSWNDIVPSVVSAVKLGISALMRSAMSLSPLVSHALRATLTLTCPVLAR